MRTKTSYQPVLKAIRDGALTKNDIADAAPVARMVTEATLQGAIKRKLVRRVHDGAARFIYELTDKGEGYIKD